MLVAVPLHAAHVHHEDGAAPNMHVELYNLKTDEKETTDVSADHPEIVAKIEKLMKSEHTASAEFPFPALDSL